MNAPKTNARAWGEAGLKSAQNFMNIANTTRKYAPKYGDIAEAGIKARAFEKQSAIRAEAAVRKAEIKSAGVKEAANIKVDAFKAKESAKKGIRKAGMVAAAGKAIGLGLTKDEPMPRPDYSSEYAYLDEQDAKGAQKRTDAISDFNSTSNPGTNKPTDGDAVGKVTVPSPKAEGGKYTGNDPGMRLMNNLVGQGYSPVSAAAIAGNAQHESANFTAHEEFEPNAYGTKGAGFLQWTNSRRNEFENWAASQGLDPKSFEASSGYIGAELAGGAHWSGGMNTDRFKGIQDLNEATIAFQDHYLRPSKQYAHTDRRLNNAQNLLSQWQQL